MLTTYKIKNVLSKRAQGITQASFCTLNGILKFDSVESPHCVYNEMVAEHLARLLNVPIARGVITSTGDGPAFASLEVASPGLLLPEMLRRQADRVAAKYPQAVAALVAFDLWIGNWDRGSNLKASLTSPHLPVFCAFDHSHALLSVDKEPTKSCDRLASGELVVEYHPFFGRFDEAALQVWIARLGALDPTFVREACLLERPFRAVTYPLQTALAEALVKRAEGLSGLVRQHATTIGRKT